MCLFEYVLNMPTCQTPLYSGRIWDCRTGRSVHTLQGHVKQVLCIDFAPNGYLVRSPCAAIPCTHELPCGCQAQCFPASSRAAVHVPNAAPASLGSSGLSRNPPPPR